MVSRVSVLLLCAVSLVACTKGSQSSSTTSATNSMAASPNANLAAANGGSVYMQNCSSCHGSNGKGQPGAFPPLVGNPVVTGDSRQVIHIVKAGLTGPIKVKGQSYNGQMPSWSGTLKNDQIAAVVSYIRSSWGNKAGSVTPDHVAATK